MIFVNNDDVMGKNIRYLRQEHGLPLREFAAKVGTDPDSLHAIETGKTMEINGGVLYNICAFFHMSVETLVENFLK